MPFLMSFLVLVLSNFSTLRWYGWTGAGQNHPALFRHPETFNCFFQKRCYELQVTDALPTDIEREANVGSGRVAVGERTIL